MRDPCRASPPRVRAVLHDQGSRARRRTGPGRLPVAHRAARGNDPGGEPRRRTGHDGGIRAASPVMSGKTRLADNGQAMRILVVDDEETFRFVIGNRLKGSGHLVETAASGEAALERIAEKAFDVMLLDLRMPGLGGLEALRRLAETGLPCEVVVLTGQPDYDDCVAAMKLGAFHYLRKPMEPALIEETLGRAVEHRGLQRDNAALRRMLGPTRGPDFVGESPAIHAVLELAQKAAAGDSRVVVLGESGTGKWVLARRIHEQSRRRHKAFLDVHCGTMAHALLDSELFGHERGAL